MKITFACIVFNGDYVLKQLIENIYPFAHKIIFVDGVVKYWADRGYTGSTDSTVDIIKNFPDPENKIVLHEKVVANEKTELCRTFMQSVPDDTDYLWCNDSDELFKPEDIMKVIAMLESQQPHSVSFRSITFFGGFQHIMTGFEAGADFKRLLKYEPGCSYMEHRPPTLSVERNAPSPILITGERMRDVYGVQMYHYSYVFPKQVYEKVEYYKAAVSKENCIDDYFYRVWFPWVIGSKEMKQKIEDEFNGVHEFIPTYRGECRTTEFTGEHPEVIKLDLDELEKKVSFNKNDFPKAYFERLLKVTARPTL